MRRIHFALFQKYRPGTTSLAGPPWSGVEAVLYGRATGAPLPVPTAECVAVAKRDLTAGETLDGSGGKTVLGMIERAAIALGPHGVALRKWCE